VLIHKSSKNSFDPVMDRAYLVQSSRKWPVDRITRISLAVRVESRFFKVSATANLARTTFYNKVKPARGGVRLLVLLPGRTLIPLGFCFVMTWLERTPECAWNSLALSRARLLQYWATDYG
jgi:hypothetical protein